MRTAADLEIWWRCRVTMCGPQLSFSGQTGHYVILLNGPPWSAGQRLVGEQRWTLAVVPFRLVPPRPGMAVDIAQSSSPWYTAQEQPDPCPPIPNIWTLPPCEMSESWFCRECLCEMSLESGTRGFPNRGLPQTKKLFVPKDGETVEVQQRRTSEFSYGAWGIKVQLPGPLLCKFPDGMGHVKTACPM